ncbi:hypothetical protein GA0070618_3868 [Micromonospora echinospora]|uniref:Uncharacterized protein n=1 Tax=Micromonospora echinospora TaxID=1877 RepID=A0A1C4YDJ5_MICEC|nr:hypothetical protein [Micromonospora echinospora]SCF18803.1 hypothetical protein GA0070618_3868 [Micromonospora echinospora]
MTALRAGDLLHVTQAASVQFHKPIVLRLIRVLDWPTFDGWVWLDGYQLDTKGDAVARRSIFVQPVGLRKLTSAPAPRRRAGSRPRTTSAVSRA